MGSEVRPVKLSKDAKLAGRVVCSDPAALDLVKLAVRTDCIGGFGGLRGQFPPERSAEEILRQISDWIVGASDHATPPKLVCSGRVRPQQLGGRDGFER